MFSLISTPQTKSMNAVYYEEIHKEIDQLPDIDMDCRVIIGGDFNVILEPNLDGSGGGDPKLKDSCIKVENICSNLDLIDIWRIRNPGVKRFSWRQKV